MKKLLSRLNIWKRIDRLEKRVFETAPDSQDELERKKTKQWNDFLRYTGEKQNED